MDIIANWIWSDDSDGRGYNLCSIFRRDFRLAALPVTARLAVTADSFYRLKVNGQWLNDGPCRSLPGHCQYDVYDLDGLLRPLFRLRRFPPPAAARRFSRPA